MSGTAPMGICVKEKTPKQTIKIVPKRIINLFFKLNFIIFSSIIHYIKVF